MDADPVARRVEEIRRSVPHALPPKADEKPPDWLKDGVESLPDFFNETAELWDARFGDEPDSPFLEAMAVPIPATDGEIRILDIGCGTGLELAPILKRAPRARLTGIDVAPKMLAELRRKYRDRLDQIQLVEGSCLDLPFGDRTYDFVVSRLTMHHFPPDTKLEVYRRIRSILVPGGRYVEGDQSATEDAEHHVLEWYHRYVSELPGGATGRWNYDITLSAGTQQDLFRAAGFADVRLTAEHRNEAGNGWAVFVVGG